jgi:hypothetical protein
MATAQKSTEGAARAKLSDRSAVKVAMPQRLGK